VSTLYTRYIIPVLVGRISGRFYCPVPDAAKMLNATGYRNRIFYLLTWRKTRSRSVRYWMTGIERLLFYMTIYIVRYTLVRTSDFNVLMRRV